MSARRSGLPALPVPALGSALGLALVVLASVGADPRCAPPEPDPAVLYELTPDSSFFEGCLPPCLCPSLEPQNLQGTLKLELLESDEPSLFDVYDVFDVDWLLVWGGQEIAITGAGTYRIGGEDELVHQLELDLAVGDAPVEHFDSGLVPGGASFPAIDTTISIHGQRCFDTVIEVRAEPTD